MREKYNDASIFLQLVPLISFTYKYPFKLKYLMKILVLHFHRFAEKVPGNAK